MLTSTTFSLEPIRSLKHENADGKGFTWREASPGRGILRHSDAAGGGELPAASECRSMRSEEHTSELQSRENLVCRLLLEKKKKHRPYDLSAAPHRAAF